MDLLMIGHAWRRLVCWILSHDYVMSIPSKSLVNVWCKRCGNPFPIKL